jgi:transaldolase
MNTPRIYLDSAEPAHIQEAVSTGLVDGIATNPNKIAQSGKTYRQALEEIRACFAGPIAFQAMGATTDEIIRHALEIHAMDPGLAVKVVANRIGLPAIKPLVAAGVRTNATLIFNPAQALLAAQAGSPFISPFIGRARMAGGDGIAAIGTMRRLLEAWGLSQTCIIGASIKDVAQVVDVVLAGAHAVAVPFPVFEAMMEHPLTEQGYRRFTEEFSALTGRAPREEGRHP